MADYNIKIQVSNGNEVYDELHPDSVSDVGVFNKGTSSMVSTNLQDAIVELYNKGR